jgi:hypothetical protein
MTTSVLYTGQEIAAALTQTHDQIVSTVEGLPVEALTRRPVEGWCAAEYLLHLILSVRPTGKAVSFPPEKLTELFGEPDHASRSYDAFVALYQQALANGVRAQQAPGVMPHLPEDVPDLKGHLLAEWDRYSRRLNEAVPNWSEAALDACGIPHPAVGMLTVREMLFFTVHHNRHHLGDIQTVAAG